MNRFSEDLDFWVEHYMSSIIRSIELLYKDEILQNWYVSDLVMNKEKILVKWCKRLLPLSLEEVRKEYREVEE